MVPDLHEKTLRGLSTGWLEAGSREGTKPIVIMLHGFPDVADCWEFQTNFLAERYHVIAPYIRGAGPSENARDVGRYGPDSVALDVLEILAEVDPERRSQIFLVGHDLGSVHAWHLADLLKKRVAGLVIINGLTIAQMARRLSNPRQLVKSWYMYVLQLPVLPEGLFKRFGDRLVKFAHVQGGLAPTKRPEAALLRSSLVGPVNQYRAFARALPKTALRRQNRLSCPVLAIFGADDAFIEPPTQFELARDAANLTVRILPGNHWLHRDEPDKINKLLGDFFAANETKS